MIGPKGKITNRIEVKIMPSIEPKFTKSPYFVAEPGNWHLKAGAPPAIQEEFEKYMQSIEDPQSPGTINGNTIDYPYEK